MMLLPPRATRSDTPCPTRRSSALVDHQVATGLERHFLLQPLLDFVFDAVEVEDRAGAAVVLDALGQSGLFGRQQGGHELRGERAQALAGRSEEPTSELQSLTRISSAGFCLKKNKSTH